MKYLKITGLSFAGILLAFEQVYAGCPTGAQCGAVPEIDGTGAFLAIGLVAGLVALFRERFFHK